MKTERICEKGHIYFKSGECPSCPICEASRKPQEGLRARLSAPARRALERMGIERVEQLAAFKEAEIRSLHGIGPNAMQILEATMAEVGVKFNGQN